MPLRAEAPSTTWTGQSGSLPHAGVRVWSAGLGVALLVGCAAPDRPEPAAWTVTVLAQGGPLHATNGMHFGPDGRLYVVSASSAEVAALDAESGAVLERWGPEEGVQGPDDLIFGPDGSLYWTEFAFGDVARRTPDGTTTVIASPGPGVNPITFSDDGRLFVSQCALGDHLFELDPDGSEEPRLITDQLGPGLRPQRHGLGPGRQTVRSAASRQRGGAGRRRSRHLRNGRLGIRPSGRAQVRLAAPAARARQRDRRAVPGGHRERGEGVGRPDRGRQRQLGLRRGRPALRVELHPRLHRGGPLGPETNRTVVAGGVSFPGGLAWLPAAEGGGRLFLADRRALRELDPETGAEVHVVPGVGSDVGEALSAHPHGAQLLLSGATSVSIWDPDADRLVARFEGFEQAVDAPPAGRRHHRERVRDGQRPAFQPGLAR